MSTSLTLAQFSDSHLFACPEQKHHGAPVSENLKRVCQHISQDKNIDLVIFTGDLTQDHSEASYQLFVDIVKEFLTHLPIFYLAGNHDDVALLNTYLKGSPFVQKNLIENEYWQFHLINSKSKTPAGTISPLQLANITSETKPDKFQFFFMHHHPKNVDYFIDRHGLENQYHFWDWLENQANVKGIACGHVHRAMTFNVNISQCSVPVFTCPATSIQFAKHPNELVAEATSPAYRTLTFDKDGTIATNVVNL